MIKIIIPLLAVVFASACSSDETKGYFTLSELIERNGNPQLVEENDSGEFDEIYYYLDPANRNRVLMYGMKGDAVIAIGHVVADADSPLKQRIAENQSERDNPITRP